MITGGSVYFSQPREAGESGVGMGFMIFFGICFTILGGMFGYDIYKDYKREYSAPRSLNQEGGRRRRRYSA